MPGRRVWISGIAAVVLLAALWVGYDLFRSWSRAIDCPDGKRRTIDTRAFATQDVGYAVEFEAGLADKTKLSGKVDPRLHQQLSEALQQSNEFRKFLVHGYNSCAVSAAQYAQYGARFQALGDVARQIDGLTRRTDLAEPDRQQLAKLVVQYIELLRKGGE